MHPPINPSALPSATDKRAQLAARMRARDFCVAPGVFDLISARVADRLGFDCLYMTGYGVSASHLGLPDAGLAGFGEMCGRAAAIAGSTATPLIADGDTGYGGLLNVQHTVRGYEAAGVAGIQLEDQVFPKKCGHTKNRRVEPLEVMVEKIAVAAESRTDPNFLLVARTDSRTAHGLDEALERGKAFAQAGADIIFIESPESDAEFAQVAAEIDAPLLANMVEGGRSPVLSRERLGELGFAIAIYPATGFLSAAAAMDSAFRHLRDSGSSTDSPAPMLPFGEMNSLMGFDSVWDFEARWPQKD